MTPDVIYHNPDPQYLRKLLARAGLTQNQAADRLGIGHRTMRSYLSTATDKSHQAAPYCVQFALEALAR